METKERIALKDKPTLTIEEAASLYNIGEHKLRCCPSN